MMDHKYEAVFKMGRLGSFLFSSGGRRGGGERMTLKMRLD